MSKMCHEFLVSMCVKFCCLLPKRACLVIFAILKILADLVGTIVFGYIGLTYIMFKDQPIQSIVASFVFIPLALILDIAFMIILIVGVWKNSNPLYKLTYFYSIVSLVLAVGVTVVNIIITYSTDDNIFKDLFGDDLSNTENFFIYITLIGIYTLIHTYMIIFMKREMKKTENLPSDQENIIKLSRNTEVAYGRFE